MDEEQDKRPRQLNSGPGGPGVSNATPSSDDGGAVAGRGSYKLDAGQAAHDQTSRRLNSIGQEPDDSTSILAAANSAEGVYDDKGFEQSAPLDNKNLREREESDLPKSSDDDVNYTGEESGNSAFNRLRGSFNRKRSIIYILVGLTGFGGILGGAYIAVPLKATHDAMQLLKPMENEESDSEVRITRLWAFARSGEIGETRVGWLGSYSARKSAAKFKNLGFEVTEKTGGGRASKVTYDMSKYSPGENTAKAADRLAKELGVPREYVKVDPLDTKFPGGKVRVETPDGKALPTKASRAMYKDIAKKTYGSQKLGRVVTAYKLRPVIKYNGAFSKLHPIKALQVATLDKTTAWDKARKAKKVERSEKAKARIAELKSKYGPNLKPIAGAALAQQALCIAKDSAYQASLASNENVVMPARNEALESISLDSQWKSGDDFNNQQFGTILNSHNDKNGVGLGASRAMSALQNNGKGVGEDLDPEIKAAFKSENWGASIESVINNYAGGEWVCSNAGQAVGAGVGIIAVIAAAPTGGASLVAYTGFTAASAAATIVAVNAVTGLIQEMVSGEQLTQEVAGAYGGSIKAFGARSLAEASYVSKGGAEVPGTNDKIFYDEVRDNKVQAFKEKSFASRTFDIQNPDSMAGKLFQRTDVSSSGSLNNLARTAVSLPGSVGKNLAAMFSAKAFAEGTPDYDWGFPLYGFTREDFYNPIVEDPYDNAERAIQLIKSSDAIKDRAKTCFGVEFTQDEGGRWYTKPVDNPDGDPELMVITSTAKYHDANCAEKSDDWLRVRMFIFDSTALEAYTCLETSVTEQQQLAICDDYDSAKPKESAESNIAAEGDADLSLLATDTDQIPCYGENGETKDLGVVQSKFTGDQIVPSGKAPKIRLCIISTIHGNGEDSNGNVQTEGAVVMSALSKAYFNLGKDALADGVRLIASSSFRLGASCNGTGNGRNGCAPPGKSAHQSGAAIDFANMGPFTPTGDPSSCSGRMTWDSPEWRWMRDNAENYGIYQFSQESWHWDPFYVIGNRCAKNGPGTGEVQAVSTNGTSAGDIGAGFQIKQLNPYLNSPGGSITPKAITLHWWGGNGNGIDSLASALRGNNTCGSGGCSVQIGITKEGEVYQMTRNLTDLTYHAKGANSTSIGIEIEGGPADFGKDGIAKYPKKFEAVVATVKYLMKKYNIPADGSVVCNSPTGVHPHKAFEVCARQGKTDIDDYYYNEVMKRVRQ